MMSLQPNGDSPEWGDVELAQRFNSFRQTTAGSVVGLMPITQTLDSAPRFGEGLLVGDESLIQTIRETTVGRPLRSWDPCRPDWSEVNRFASPQHVEVGQTNHPNDPCFSSKTNAIRMLVYDGAICVGWFGCLRERGEPVFTPAELAQANNERHHWVAELTARHREEHQLLRQSAAHLVIDQQGHLVGQSAGVEAWMTTSRLRRISGVAAHVRRDGAGVHAIGRYAFRGVELHSASGSLVYLNAPLGTFGSVALAAMTKRQLEVAALIAIGLTSHEAAEELSISVHTLKQHLAAVYRLLGVSRRERLVAILHARGFEAPKTEMNSAGASK